MKLEKIEFRPLYGHSKNSRNRVNPQLSSVMSINKNKEEIYGLIYKIQNGKDGKIYIGQTTKESIEERFEEHIKCVKRLIKGTGKQADIRNSYLYNAMKCHGIDTFSISLVDNSAKDQDELNVLEAKYIKEFDCLAPKGYNLKDGGGGGGKHSDISINAMRATKAKNIENYRSDKIKDMPIHTGYTVDPEGREYVRIVFHPLCPAKSYNTEKYGGLENTKKIVEEKIKQLDEIWDEMKNTNAVPRDKDLPVGVYQTSTGYRVCKIIEGKKYTGIFEKSSMKTEEKKAAALEYFNLLKSGKTDSPKIEKSKKLPKKPSKNQVRKIVKQIIDYQEGNTAEEDNGEDTSNQKIEDNE